MKPTQSSLFLLCICSIISSYFYPIYANTNTQLFLTKKDSLHHQQLIDSCTFYSSKNKYIKAIFYAEKILENVTKINDSSAIAHANFRLGYYYRKKSDVIKSFEYYKRSYGIYIALKDSINIGRKAANIANIQNSVGDYLGAEITAVEGLKYIENSTQNKFKASLYNVLAISTKRQNNLEDALYYYNKALSTANNPLLKSKITNNIALVHIKSKKYHLAISILSSLKTSTDQFHNLTIRNNLAYAKSKINDLNAEDELLDVLRMGKEIDDFSGQFASLIHLTEYYKDKEDNDKALNYARQAYYMGKKLSSPASRMEALSYLITLEENPKIAAIEFQILNDSINTVRQQTKNQFAKIRYDTERNREENLILKAKTAEQQVLVEKTNIRNLILISSIIVLFLISIFVYYVLRLQFKKEKLKEVYTTETRISKKVHDELANDIYQVMTRLQTNNTANNIKILDQLENIYSRTRDISRENNTIHTGANYANELREMIAMYGSDKTNIIITGLEPDFWNNVSKYKKIESYRALQELMTNMKKHSSASLVAITFKRAGNKIQISYVDNGVGIKKNLEFMNNGLQNVENRISAISGIITFDTKAKKGLRANLTFLA